MKNLNIITLTALSLLISACAKETPISGSSGIMVAPKAISRFVATGNNLYAATKKGLTVYSISNANDPSETKNIGISYSALTNFTAYQDAVVVGNAFGIKLYDVPITPSVSQQSYSYYNECTPMASNGKCVFISERTNSSCGALANQLQVIDVRTSNQVVTKYPMTAPYGLAVDGDNLFICDGGAIKFYDASNPAALVLKQTLFNLVTELTAQNGKLAAIGTNTIYQYSYATGTLVEQSSIKIK